MVVEPTGHPEVECGLGEWDAVVYGHHRFLVEVSGGSAAVAVRSVIPWRRHDPDPAKVDTWVISSTGRRVRNVLVRNADAGSGELIFEPIDGPGRYAVYYLPFAHTGSAYYPQAVYRTRTATADPEWMGRIRSVEGIWLDLPSADVVRYEASSAIDSFAGIGFAATTAERDALIKDNPEAAFLIFGESRANGIGRADYLPARWARSTPGESLTLAADRGEFHVFQIGVYACADLDQLEVEAEGFPFPVRHLTGGGIGESGEPFTRQIQVADGWVQSLWFGIDLPADCEPGDYSGAVVVSAAGQQRRVEVSLQVGNEVVVDHGIADRERLARLRWLDDPTGHGHDLVAPYEPIKINGRSLTILGREVQLGELGLPDQLRSTFNPAVTSADGPGVDILAQAVALELGVRLTPAPFEVTQLGPNEVQWQVTASGDGVDVQVDGRLESDGFLDYRISIAARDQLAMDDFSLAIPVRQQVADYWMGLGRQGGRCPEELDWSWDVADRNQDCAWLGTANAGLQVSLRDDAYRRPLNTNYYKEQPLREPRWANDGAGRVRLDTDDSARTLTASTGPLTVAAGETLVFDVRFLLTPFKPIEPGRHFSDRYVHQFAEPAEIAALGGTVVNLHHANPPTPYINDPMLAEDRLADYVAEAHRNGLRVKIYDTVRELTRFTPETPALVALGHEIFAAGPGGGHAWLQEHLPSDYVPGWAATTVDDVAIVTAGESRWHNIYIKSVEHLAEQVGIDGVYLDDVSYDRTTMKRLRRVLERHRPDPLIDLHSASQYNEKDGYASSANLYLDLLPYVDRLWFGEYIDYENTDPAYWLVEVSGIPYGLMGEMLQDGGNPWRGMAFGMTGRYPSVDNRPLWQAWDQLGLPQRSMIGWWAGDDAVRTDDPQVLATAYVGEGDAVIAVASWNPEPAKVRIDPAALSRLGGTEDLSGWLLSAVAIDGFQQQGDFRADEAIEIAPGKGMLLHLHRPSY